MRALDEPDAAMAITFDAQGAADDAAGLDPSSPASVLDLAKELGGPKPFAAALIAQQPLPRVAEDLGFSRARDAGVSLRRNRHARPSQEDRGQH